MNKARRGVLVLSHPHRTSEQPRYMKYLITSVGHILPSNIPYSLKRYS